MTSARGQSTDHSAEAVPQRRRQPSNTAAGVSIARARGTLVASTKPAPHSPAAETSTAIPRGKTTRSGKNNSTARSRAA